MALLVTLFLVLVNIFNTVTTNTPKAEGLTAIEAWMLACILFVFGTLVEYAALLLHKTSIVTSRQSAVNLVYETAGGPPEGRVMLLGKLPSSCQTHSSLVPR